MASGSVDLEEENKQVEECERKISCHDVPEPVPAGMWARDTIHVNGLGQGIVVRQTPPT